MTRAEKARRIERILDRLHPLPAIPLGHSDPFTLLVAVILSAQCTDERVNRVTPALFARASTPEKMARLRVSAIERLIRPCGLAPRKARAIAKLSQILVAKHGGQVPDDMEALEALPGVGHKTASVVMLQAFGREAFPVDTHIHRLAARWGLSNGKNVVRTEGDLKKLFPPERWGKLHLQMIYFGRSHCPARGHDLTACPICSWAASSARKAAEGGRAASRRRAKAEPPGEARRRPEVAAEGGRAASRRRAKAEPPGEARRRQGKAAEGGKRKAAEGGKRKAAEGGRAASRRRAKAGSARRSAPRSRR